MYDQTSPAIAADREGNFIVTWVSERQDGELTGIFACIFDRNGNPRGMEFQVNSNWEHLQENPAIALGENGHFVIAWTSYNIEPFEYVGISARVFDGNGNPITPEFLVNEYIPDFQGHPAAAMDREGNFVIVWQSWGQDGDEFGVFGRRFDGSGTPLGREFRVNTYTTGDQFHPAVAMDDSGNFVVVWTSYGQDGDKTGVFGQRFNRDGQRLGGEFQVNFNTLGWQGRPRLAMDRERNFVVCWHSYPYTEEAYNIHARFFDKTAVFAGPEFIVNDHREGWQVFPSVGADGAGNYLVVWQSLGQDGDDCGIFARVFDKSGQPQMSEFQVNETAKGRQEMADVAMFSRHRFIFVWQSLQDDDSGWDIYARVFQEQMNQQIRRLKPDIKKVLF